MDIRAILHLFRNKIISMEKQIKKQNNENKKLRSLILKLKHEQTGMPDWKKWYFKMDLIDDGICTSQEGFTSYINWVGPFSDHELRLVHLWGKIHFIPGTVCTEKPVIEKTLYTYEYMKEVTDLILEKAQKYETEKNKISHLESTLYISTVIRAGKEVKTL